MPLDPITSAIVSSVISSVVEGALAPPPPVQSIGIIRTLPEESRKGVMLPPGIDGNVQIGGQVFMLSPGVQIRNELNMIILPTMVQEPVPVRFQTDFSGAVHRVWILSAMEARLPENR